MAVRMEPQYTLQKPAASDLSSSQYYYVGDNGSDQYAIKGGATGAIGAGFLQNAPQQYGVCEVAGPGGGAMAKLGGTVSAIGTELMANASGLAIATTAAGDIVCAIALDTGVSGDVIPVDVVIYRKHA